MRGIVLIPAFLIPVFAFGLAGCAGGSPATVPEVIAATDLIQAAQLAKLAGTLGPPSDAVATGSVALTLNEAANGLVGDAALLKAGISRPKGTATHIEFALPSFQALRSDYVTAGPAQTMQAGRMQGYLDAFLAAARAYNADATAAGLPRAALPGG